MVIRVLSAGAPANGVPLCAEAYETKTGTKVEADYATAPVIRERLAADEGNAEVLIAPTNAMEDFQAQGLVVTSTVADIGSVRSGVVIKESSDAPDISTEESLKAAILAADSLAYNTASSGQYIATMMEKLGIAAEVADKTVRPNSAEELMDHLANSSFENEIGFGQQTAIRRLIDAGVKVKLVGPLPESLDRYTSYQVAVLTDGDNDDGRSLAAFMSSEEGLALFRSVGVA
jgi:molybdate transport system substrate-binding protein